MDDPAGTPCTGSCRQPLGVGDATPRRAGQATAPSLLEEKNAKVRAVGSLPPQPTNLIRFFVLCDISRLPSSSFSKRIYPQQPPGQGHGHRCCRTSGSAFPLLVDLHRTTSGKICVIYSSCCRVGAVQSARSSTCFITWICTPHTYTDPEQHFIAAKTGPDTDHL